MAPIKLELPDEVFAAATKSAAQAGYTRLEDYLLALLRDHIAFNPLLPDRSAFENVADLEAKLLAGLQSPARELPANHWEEKSRKLIERHRESKAG